MSKLIVPELRVATLDEVMQYGGQGCLDRGLSMPILGAAGITIDASTPALKTASSGTSIVSNSFSPPAGSTLVVPTGLGAGATRTISAMTDSLGSHLTWAKSASITNNQKEAGIWLAQCPSAQTAMTITATVSGSGANILTIGVIVLTSAGGEGVTNTASAGSGTPSVTLAGTTSGSLILAQFTVDTTTAPTIPSGQTNIHNGSTYVIRSVVEAHGHRGRPRCLRAEVSRSTTPRRLQ